MTSEPPETEGPRTEPGSARPYLLIVDFGSQYTHLITRRVRELGVYSQMLPCWAEREHVRTDGLRGVILSGGPNSVYAEGAPGLPDWLGELDVPVLGICYGMQLMAYSLGGSAAVQRGTQGGEYGPTKLERLEGPTALLADVGSPTRVWMSHGDRVVSFPEDFRVVARSAPCPYAAVESAQRRWYGLQFHPEVHHSEEGMKVLAHFVHDVCHVERTWEMGRFAEEKQAEIAQNVGSARVVLGLSGGVDSSVAAVLVHRAIGDRLTCIFVDNGLLRAGEAEEVETTFRDHYHMDLRVVRAEDRFLTELAGVSDPETKRKIIGRVFVEVFEQEAKSIPDARFLGQGTLYPDVIESASPHGGPSVTIKTHHNVGGLPERLGFELLEPLRELFKDEVRELGRQLGVPERILTRHPFPGPGLAVRCLGAIERADLELLRAADLVAREELETSGWMARTSQAFVVLLPVRSVGVQGDLRTYERVAALRVVTTPDFMTADWADLPRDLLARISNRIINEVRGINRVVYDISSKPPATIEWE